MAIRDTINANITTNGANAITGAIMNTTLTAMCTDYETLNGNEASARAAADTTLQANITSEASTRETADATLQTNITNEATARAAADTTLQANITSEASTRETADAQMRADIDAIDVDNMGDAHAKSIDLDELPKVCGFPMFIFGTAAPAVTPDFIGQFYIDTTNQKVYCATGVANASSFKTLN